ncbi:hypothetical protein [Bacillus atrophaeus]|uniref:hypothetical protein n=1 Tax=Bacillus atrophaeus TaxID=1452 RepID=UPI0022828BF4|nr:hypothetical protein [Bacillus atrophaeus]MCY8958286.1 hypothetical protein [Bacillus atrophaeus]MCY8963859.1 hypothetical protein [Bacillus atrophaeus]MCY9440121.1 hypothetical protein [Bacillus atrophaeus]MEC0648400.1 hypothetical protein [Bacillus atrophaeus]
MTEEVKELRCTLAETIAENERLKEGRKKLSELVVRLLIANISLMDETFPEWRYFAREEIEKLKELCK